jgi:hypothetical protein
MTVDERLKRLFLLSRDTKPIIASGSDLSRASGCTCHHSDAAIYGIISTVIWMVTSSLLS